MPESDQIFAPETISPVAQDEIIKSAEPLPVAAATEDKPLAETPNEADFNKEELARVKRERNFYTKEARRIQRLINKDERPPLVAPNEDDYAAGEWDKFNEDKIAHAVEKTIRAKDEAQVKLEMEAEQIEWTLERIDSVGEQSEQFLRDHPYLQATMDESVEILRGLPDSIKDIFLEADNAPLALANLGKQGKLKTLAFMSPARAAMIIGAAQNNPFPKKEVSSAPAPMQPAKGLATARKDISSPQLTDAEFAKMRREQIAKRF